MLVLTLVAIYAISMHEVTTRERELGIRGVNPRRRRLPVDKSSTALNYRISPEIL